MRILIAGDVVGKPGRSILKEYLDKKKMSMILLLLMVKIQLEDLE